MSAPLHFGVTDGVASITFSRPECRNALSRELLDQLSHALAQAGTLAAHAVVISGEGSFFSAGADLRELDGTAADALFDDHVAAAVEAIGSAPMPVIAAIEGACIGAALDLALACDLRVVAEGAFLELPAIRMGLLYNPTALARIGKQVPSTTLARLLLAGERINGRDTLAAGLATHTAPDGLAVARALEIAARFRDFSTKAVEATKRFIRDTSLTTMDTDAWQHERMELLCSQARRQAVDRARKSPGT